MTEPETQLDLSDPASSGIYPLHADDVEPLRQALSSCGAQLHVIDLAQATDKAQLMTLLARTLAFPSTFGHNWDALADCLEDLSWLPSTGHALLLLNASSLQAHDANTLDILIEVLVDATAQWTTRDTALLAFVLEDASDSMAGDSADADAGHAADASNVLHFTLDGPWVALNDLLKLCGLCDSGGAGKALVASGQVYVDDAQELRKTCKIRVGQRVRLGDTLIVVGAATGEADPPHTG